MLRWGCRIFIPCGDWRRIRLGWILLTSLSGASSLGQRSYMYHFVFSSHTWSVFLSWQSFWNIVSDAIYGMSLATLTQINHVNSEVMWPEPKDDKMKLFSMDWAEMQCASTQDYATDSWFWTVFTGGLNHQTSHHLFPLILQSYYPQITPTVRKTWKEFGVCYNYFPTFWELSAVIFVTCRKWAGMKVPWNLVPGPHDFTLHLTV